MLEKDFIPNLASSNVVMEGESIDHTKENCKSLDCWMEQLPESLHGLPLNSLAIPGSHDSCSYSITPNSNVSPDQPDLYNSNFIHCIGCLSKPIIYNWSKTQNLNCIQQLECGIRYFDLRVSSDIDEKDLYLVHGLYGALVLDVLKEIKQFLQSHTKEVIMLDFQHFYKMTPSHHHSLLNMLTETFGSLICPVVSDASKLTLSWLWERGFRILLFYRQDCIAKYHPFLWPSDCIPNPWIDTDDIKKLLNELTKNYQNGRSSDKFYVTQGVLTPTLNFILLHLFGTLKNVLGHSTSDVLMDWLKDKHPGSNNLNVVICDFVENNECSVPRSIIDLNYKILQNIPAIKSENNAIKHLKV